ncbi:MAG: biotin transporter BioY [Flavobacteriales bacterium]|nr:biotin transporter BioY [Flavobacteriales bacterium]
MNAEKLIANSLGTLIAVAALGASAQLSISLPESVSVAPITGQSLAILLIAHLLKWRWGSLALFLYVLIGALGVPVFSNFSSGTEVLFGPTFGYFIGFGLSILVIGRLAETQKSKFAYYFLQMLIGTLIILLCGWLGLFRYLEPMDAFKKGIIPFLPGGLTKILLGAIILSVVRRFKNVMSLGQS